MELFDLRPIYDGTKSFYGKATVLIKGDYRMLRSYGENVAYYNVTTGEMKLCWDLCKYNGIIPVTTLRHLNEFCIQYGFKFNANTKEFTKTC